MKVARRLAMSHALALAALLPVAGPITPVAPYRLDLTGPASSDRESTRSEKSRRKAAKNKHLRAQRARVRKAGGR